MYCNTNKESTVNRPSQICELMLITVIRYRKLVPYLDDTIITMVS